MLAWFVLPLGFLAQTTGVPARQISRRPADSPPRSAVRVWLPDSALRVGSPARVFVRLSQPGYLVVLHVNPAGFIRVLFPSTPEIQDIVPAGTFELAGGGSTEAFVVAARGGGTILAASAPSPWRFDGLVDGNRWDYENALLLQPTAGSQFAALLDIADRMAGGARYQYDLALYRAQGGTARGDEAVLAAGCPGCAPSPRYVRYEPYETSAPAPGNVATDVNYAPSSQAYSVSCAGASLVNSFCGVQDNRVWNTYQEQSYNHAEPVYIPYFVPIFERRRDSTPPPPPPAAQTLLTQGLRAPRTKVIPPAPIRPPPIVVQQPSAPSRPARSDNAGDQPVLVGPGEPRIVSTVTLNRPATTPSWFRVPVNPPAPTPRIEAGGAQRITAPSVSSTVPATRAVTRGGFVPSRALLRTIATARR